MILTKLHPAWLLGTVFLLAIFRFVPHPPNATPIIAMALFAGAVFSKRIYAYLVPLAAMLFSDLVLGFHSTILYVYIAVIAAVLLGSTLKKISVFRLGIITITASFIFYLITNFGAWLHHDMYSQNWLGLIQAYIAGLPFFRNSIIANLMFTYLTFYGLAWLENEFSFPRIAQH